MRAYLAAVFEEVWLTLSHPNKARGTRLEYRTARLLSKLTGEVFKRVPGSGAIPGMPGDVEGPLDLIQNKYSSERTTQGDKSIRIKKADLLKITRQAEAKGKKPSLVFAFNGDRQLWAIVPIERIWSANK